MIFMTCVLPEPDSQSLLLELSGSGSFWSCSDSLYVAVSSFIAYEVLALTYDLASSLFVSEASSPEDVLYRRMHEENRVEAVVSIAHDTNQLFLLVGCSPKDIPNCGPVGMVDPTVASVYHPFTRLLDFIYVSVYSIFDCADFQVLLSSLGERNGILAPTSLAVQLGLTASALLALAMVYFSLFSSGREEWQADLDFTTSSLTAESEKELFSVDDAVTLVLTMFFFFGVYFGFFLVNSALTYSEALGLALPVPIVLFSLVLIPVNLIADFGLLFVAYLRGASNTASLFFELVYDYIGVVAFFTRLVVQFVRIALMVVVYMMMHETVVFTYMPLRAFVAGDSFMDELFHIYPTVNSVTFFFVMALPARMGYWVYEVLHTFFVVTVQFMAFFTIVF